MVIAGWRQWPRFATEFKRMGQTPVARALCSVAQRVPSQWRPRLRGQLAASHLARLGSVASPVDRVQLADTAATRLVDQLAEVRTLTETVVEAAKRLGQSDTGE